MSLLEQLTDENLNLTFKVRDPHTDHRHRDNMRKDFQKLYGTDPKHTTISTDPWLIAKWNAEDVPKKHLGDGLNKLWRELIVDLYNNKKTVPRPLQLIKKYNVVTTAGLRQIAQNRTGESNSTTSHMGIGTGAGTELRTDLQLDSESARKEITTRRAVDRQEQYATSWTTADTLGAEITIREAGLFDSLEGGNLLARLTLLGLPLTTGTTVTVQAFVNHESG